MRTVSMLFALGLLLRTLFWLATGDRWDTYAVAFQGDAPLWQELASASAHGVEHELLRLPLRPPGMHWLVSAFWDGAQQTAWLPRLVFTLIGALIAPLVFLLLRPHCRPITATFAGVLCAAGSGLLLLGSGPHSELPYLVLLLVTFFDQERLRTKPTAIAAIRWAVLHGLLCLLRAEHALTFALLLGLLALLRAPRWRRTTLLALATFAVTLAPWHIHAWGAIDTYNTERAPTLPPAGIAMPGGLPWSDAALTRLHTLPSFQHGPVYQFVTDTVRTRGGRTVGADDLDIVRAAYDCWPRPFGHPFVCLYGGLNFFLANSPEADGGFSGAALDRPPPLAGGPSRYPPGLLQVLPRSGTLVLSYPPHLGRLLDGYSDGLSELANDPGGALARGGRKLMHFAEGAASGLGGYALPIGLSGVRRPVDLVTATGAWAWVYRIALLTVALVGLWSLRRSPWIWPWVVLLASKLIVTTLFFGYARQGALCFPVLAIGIAVALQGMLRSRERWLWLVAGALVLAEGARTFTCDVVLEEPDGTALGAMPVNDSREVFVRYR